MGDPVEFFNHRTCANQPSPFRKGQPPTFPLCQRGIEGDLNPDTKRHSNHQTRTTNPPFAKVQPPTFPLWQRGTEGDLNPNTGHPRRPRPYLDPQSHICHIAPNTNPA